MVEGEGKNRGNRKSTAKRTIRAGVGDRFCGKPCEDAMKGV